VWQGDTAWWRFTVRFETLDRLVPTAIWQWHGEQAPWIEIRLQPADGRPQLIATSPGRHSAGDGVLLDGVVEDRWYDVLCSTRFSSTAGEARCWVDDELRWHHTGATATGDSDASAEARCGLDRSPRSGQDPEGARGDLTTLQGPTAVAVRLDEGLEVMRDAFPSWIDLDSFESGSATDWTRSGHPNED
jgi:hypothetical protein